MTAKHRKRLNDGQEAIRRTRAKLAVGAGNVKSQVKSSQGFSFVHTFHAKETADVYGRTGEVGNALEAWAISARRARAGNCDEYAAVTYFYLLEMNTGDQITVVGLPEVHHHFVLIGDPANPEGDGAVVVDPWPAKGWAVMYEHWQYKGEKMKVTLGPTVSSGQKPLKAARKNLNTRGFDKRRFDRDLKERFDKYSSSQGMRDEIEKLYSQNNAHFWGNEYTMKDAPLNRLRAYAEELKKAVTDPLSLSNEDFEAMFRV